MKKLLFSTKIINANLALFLLRVGFGSYMLFGHGWSKLMHFSDYAGKFPSVMGLNPTISLSLNVFAEVFCAALLIIGLFTRLSLAMLMATMAVAAFIIHGGDAFATKEMAILYLTVYIVLFLWGPGKYSIDELIK